MHEHLTDTPPEIVSPGAAPRSGNLALLITDDHKRYLIRLVAGHTHHTHLGPFRHDEIIGVPWGSAVFSDRGHRALVLQPALVDLIKQLKRSTQIIYPKDAAYLVHRLSLHAGSRVIEAGTGSGGLTVALAWAVAPTGIVYTHEVRPDIYQIARSNLERVGLLPYVRLFQTDIEHGFRASDVDAVFLDVREPWLYLEHVRNSLRPGGFFASLLPTANQVIDLLQGLEQHHFADVAVEELILRGYKPTPDRFRPEDDIVGHTGFLVFARAIAAEEDMARWQHKERQRYEARQRAQVELAAKAERRSQELEQGGKKYPKLPLP
jgi:tRNA (adenine57-N1/adenine58-N1)-methyltransferase